VAGAVADALVVAYARDGVRRAWVNNGGDIALHLTQGATVQVGLFADLARFEGVRALRGLTADGRFTVRHATPVRGVATSGWRGRSFSRGIADSVTVLARTAAEADAAATVVANAVDADHAGVVRRPARELKDGSDLGDIAVTVDVPVLPPAVVQAALDRGASCARELIARARVQAAVLVCQGQARVCGPADTLQAVDAPQAHASKLVQSLLNEH
jgi:ApbE superfamily uncharacterized protein (UPF0280 family)